MGQESPETKYKHRDNDDIIETINELLIALEILSENSYATGSMATLELYTMFFEKSQMYCNLLYMRVTSVAVIDDRYTDLSRTIWCINHGIIDIQTVLSIETFKDAQEKLKYVTSRSKDIYQKWHTPLMEAQHDLMLHSLGSQSKIDSNLKEPSKLIETPYKTEFFDDEVEIKIWNDLSSRTFAVSRRALRKAVKKKNEKVLRTVDKFLKIGLLEEVAEGIKTKSEYKNVSANEIGSVFAENSRPGSRE